MWEWLTGAAGPVSTFPAVRTVVVEDARVVPDLVASGLLDTHSRLVVRSAETLSIAGPSVVASYRGTFAAADSTVEFDNGYQLNSRNYGSAEFLSFDRQTILRIGDADDFSAYLRDADSASLTGRFADHLTHPNVIVADVAGLGAPADDSGPYRRLFVFPDATVSTSPTGAALGDSTDGIATLDRRWRVANDASAYPDAVALDRVVGDGDRAAALLERPWVQRYLLACNVIRLVRAEHRLPGRVSGFGGRISAGLPDSADPDSSDAPVLLQIGRTHQAHDPTTGLGLAISATAVAVLESLLVHPTADDAATWCGANAGLAAGALPQHVSGLLQVLSDADVAAGWSQRAAREWDTGLS